MLLIPLQRDAESYDLFLLLQPDNLERIQQHDPCDARLHSIGEPWRRRRLREIMIGYADQNDVDVIQDMARRGETTVEIERYLSRGYQWQPERGDGGQIKRVPVRSTFRQTNASLIAEMLAFLKSIVPGSIYQHEIDTLIAKAEAASDG